MGMRGRAVRLMGAWMLATAAGMPCAWGQEQRFIDDDSRTVIVPQAWRHERRRAAAEVDLSAVDVKVSIKDQVATTSMELTLTNPHGAALEAELVIPVPDGCTVRGMQFDGTGPEPTARVLPREEARKIYDEIVRRRIDPALVEFAGYNLIRTSAFPIPAGKSQKLTVIFEQVLPRTGERVDYVLPRSDSLGETGITWTVRADIWARDGVGTVYSPSHDLAITKKDGGVVEARISGAGMGSGPVRLSYIAAPREAGAAAATFMAYPDPSLGKGEGGYFMLLAKLPEVRPEDRAKLARDIVLVLDRSGSMQGPKIEQARRAAIQVIEGLNAGDRFNIIDYSDSVASFSKSPVVKSEETSRRARAYIEGLEASGGTNILDSLQEAVRTRPETGAFPVILFLTDGRPTVGERREGVIRDEVKKLNAFERRIFGFGVGYDVNIPLLNAMASSSRGSTTLVGPDEDVEAKVSQVFGQLSGPVLLKPDVAALGLDGSETGSIREMQPAALTDIYADDQVLILGQYTSKEKIRIRLGGTSAGTGSTVSHDFTFDPAQAEVRNTFVPRIWATRKIAALSEEIRQAGADGSKASEELVAEIVRLSTRWGIMTEYTSFLAVEEDAPLAGFQNGFDAASARAADRELVSRATESASKTVADRAGVSAAAQQQNVQLRMNSLNLQAGATLRDESMRDVRFQRVRNIADRTLFWRKDRWVDSLLGGQEDQEPEATIEYASAAYGRVLDQLVREGRQGVLASREDVYLLVDGKRTLVRGSAGVEDGRP